VAGGDAPAPSTCTTQFIVMLSSCSRPFAASRFLFRTCYTPCRFARRARFGAVMVAEQSGARGAPAAHSSEKLKGRKRFPEAIRDCDFHSEARAEIQAPAGLGKYWGDWRRKHPGTAGLSQFTVDPTSPEPQEPETSRCQQPLRPLCCGRLRWHRIPLLLRYSERAGLAIRRNGRSRI